MRIYLAAPFCTKSRIRDIAEEARRAGFDVVSSWHDEKVEPGSQTCGPATALTQTEAGTAARGDLNQIKACDVFVMFAWGGLDRFDFIAADDVSKHSTGRHFEAGYAHATGKPIVHVGVSESIFTRSLVDRQALSWHAALIELVAMREAEPKAGEAS